MKSVRFGAIYHEELLETDELCLLYPQAGLKDVSVRTLYIFSLLT